MPLQRPPQGNGLSPYELSQHHRLSFCEFLQRLYQKQLFQKSSSSRRRLSHGEKCLCQHRSPYTRELHHPALRAAMLPSVPGACIPQVLLTHKTKRQLLLWRKGNKQTNTQHQNTLHLVRFHSKIHSGKPSSLATNLCAPGTRMHTALHSYRSRLTLVLCTQ